MNIDCSYIPYRETGFFSKLVCDYIEDKPTLHSFRTAPALLEEFSLFLKNRSKHIPDRSLLVECLRDQYKKADIWDDAIQNTINQLSSEHCFTVTTGQQTGILLGPLYAPLKIISAINLCKQLHARYPENVFVPVFWMATEDHDKEEIQSAFVNGKKYTWETEQVGPVGRFHNEGIDDLLDKILLAEPEFQKLELLEIFKKAYQKPTLSQATRFIVHSLFGKYGLIVLDADDIRLKSQFTSVIFKDITEGISFSEVKKASEKLSETYKIQAQGREINFFYLRDSYRERIIQQGINFVTIDKTYQWNSEELKQEIENHPDRFSPNVIMRPVYQEFILPNIAYIGGAAEIAYWLPLKGVFEAYQIPFPALLLRNSAVIIDAVNSHRMRNAGLTATDVFQSIDSLKKRKSLERFGDALHLAKLEKVIHNEMPELETLASQVSFELNDAARAFHKRLLHSIEGFSEKLIREAKKHEEIDRLRLNELFEYLYPGGSLQERKESIATFILRHDIDVIDALIDVCDPIHNRFAVMNYGV